MLLCEAYVGNGVVPFSVKGVTLNVHRCQGLLTDLLPFRVFVLIELAGDLETGLGCGGGDEVQDHLVTSERLASPVEGDEGEETVLDLVPLAGAGR